LGNHDNQSPHWYLRHGFNAVMDSFTLDYGGEKILFSHYPVMTQQSSCEEPPRFHEYRLPDGIDRNIHGHLHLRMHRDEESDWLDEEDERWFLLSLEAVGYRPVKLDDILNGKVKSPLKRDALKYVYDTIKVRFDPIPKS
jgi:calcineurin-like phosphoesterase family protein